MGKIKLIVHECFAGKQNPEDVFAVSIPRQIEHRHRAN